MKKLWLIWLLFKLALGAEFAKVKPHTFPVKTESRESDENIPSTAVKLVFPVDNSKSMWQLLPVDVQITILFDFLKPVETLRMRIINRFFKSLVNSLAEHRFSLYCGPQLYKELSGKLRLAFSINHLPLTKAAFPVLPEGCDAGDLTGLMALAYFLNMGDFVELVKRLQRLYNYHSFACDLLCFSTNRLGLFGTISRFLTRLNSPSALKALYDYCSSSNDVVIRGTLFKDKCSFIKSVDELESLVKDPFFASIDSEQKLRYALDSANALAIEYFLDTFQLPLPLNYKGRHILSHFVRLGTFSEALARKIDYSAVTMADYNACLLTMLLWNNVAHAWLMKILQEAPAELLNPHLQALKQVFLLQKIPEFVSADDLVVLLLEIRHIDEFVLQLFKESLPKVSPELADIITHLALKNEAFLSVLMLENEHFEPSFLCPDSVKYEYSQGELTVKPSLETTTCVLFQIIALLGNRIVESKWFHKAYLLLNHLLISHRYCPSILDRFAEHLSGQEMVTLSLPALQKKISLIGWFSPDFVVINAATIIMRESWSLLELSILFLNPKALKICLKTGQGEAFFAANRSKILALAHLMEAWMMNTDTRRLATEILFILEGERMSEPERKAIQPYCIVDTRPVVHYETIPVSELTRDV